MASRYITFFLKKLCHTNDQITGAEYNKERKIVGGPVYPSAYDKEVICVEMAPFNLLVLDASSHSLLLVDGLKGDALAKMAYPADYTPTGLAITSDLNKAYVPAVHRTGSGALFAANLRTNSFYRLPVQIPHPLQFALAPDNVTIYFTAPDGVLHILNTSTLELTVCGQAGNESCTCVGLAADSDNVYSAWEIDTGGVVATFNRSGQLTGEHQVEGIPTNIIYDQHGAVMIPFTSNGTCGEGLIIFRLQKNAPPSVITIQCPACVQSNGAYPCQAAVAPDGQTAYLVNEDSGSVTIVDVINSVIVDHFSIGRSISALTILPDSRFAVASSNMFSDLSLIDLVNGRLLSFTENSHEILTPIAVLPTAN